MTDRIEKIKAFLVQSPNDCFLNHALALEYIKAGDEASARKHFEINIKIDPGYVATYYHFGKLLERSGETDAALKMYEEGMGHAKAKQDMHSFNELRTAYDDLAY
jgi:tetratricopeptide (TPR) repeat protein